jgi:hypothetical protein
MDIEKKVLHETPLSEVESVNLMEKASIMFSPEKVEKAVELEVSVEVPTNRIPDFKTLQEAMEDPKLKEFLAKRIQSVANLRGVKRSPANYLKEHGILNISSITYETILIAEKVSDRPPAVRKYIEMISHNAIADMLNWYVKGGEDARI